MKTLFQLFWAFFRIGGLTFGGGYAMLPMLQKEVAEKHKWAKQEELLDYYAMGQCVPGIIASNTAVFVGQKTAGILGAIFAVVGVVFPSWIIITVIAFSIRNFTDLVVVQHAFAGIRVAVAVLIVNAIIKLWKSGIKDYVGIIIFAVTFIVSLIFNLSPAYIVVASIFAGIFAKKIGGKKQ